MPKALVVVTLLAALLDAVDSMAEMHLVAEVVAVVELVVAPDLAAELGVVAVRQQESREGMMVAMATEEEAEMVRWMAAVAAA